MIMKKCLYEKVYEYVKDGKFSYIDIGAWHKGMDVSINGVYNNEDYEEINLDVSEFAYDNAGDFFCKADNVTLNLYIKKDELMVDISYSLSTTEYLDTEELMDDILKITQSYIEKKKDVVVDYRSISLFFDVNEIYLAYTNEDIEVIEIRCFNYFVKDLNKCIKDYMYQMFDSKDLEYTLQIEDTSVWSINCSWGEDSFSIGCGE